MMKTIIKLPSLQHTEIFGNFLGETAQQGDTICLDGDLGAGKTTLAQFIAAGLEVPGEIYVSSPSFNIFHEYPGRLPLYHMDFYRLNSMDDVVDMGLDEYFYMAGISVIEWAGRAKGIYPQSSLFINLQVAVDSSRAAICSCSSEGWSDRFSSLRKKLKS